MCSGAIVQSRMTRVVVGCMNPKAGCAGSILNLLQMPQFNHQVELTTGVLEEECSQMMKTFFKELREKRYPASKLNPGTLTAPERFHLVLLRSRPDTVHGFSSRKTQISTPHTRGGFTRPMPSAQHHPCYSGLQVQGTATTPAAQVHIITEDGGKVNWGRGFFSFTPVLFQKNPVPN